MRSRGSLFLFLFAAGGLLSARECFVSPSGSDQNPGTEAKPWKTIAFAAENARPGDKVTLAPGLYREQVKFRKSGKEGSPVIFCGTRGKNGEFLTVVEPEGANIFRWEKAPEIAPGVWKTPLQAEPKILTMDNRMILLVNQVAMSLPRTGNPPEEINDSAMLTGHNGRGGRRIAGLDLLSLPENIRVSNIYFGKFSVPLWPVIGHVMAGWTQGTLYVRFADGDTPDKHRFTASNGAGFTISQASHLVFQNLWLRNSRIQFSIRNNAHHVVIENSLLMHGGSRIAVEKGSHHITVRNNILTLGFITGENFRSRSSEDMTGGVMYLVFKYIAGVSRSDDMGVFTQGEYTAIHDNVICGGLMGIRAFGSHGEVYRNSVRNMSSVGIITGPRTTGCFHDNLIMDCGIPLRIHEVRHDKGPREEYYYRNLFIQKERSGSMIYVHCESWKSKKGDKVNFEKQGKKLVYKQHPPAPVDPGKFYFYHNTFRGGDEPKDAALFSVDRLSKTFREPQPFLFMNNIIKGSRHFSLKFQDVLAGNLFYFRKDAPKIKPPADRKFLDCNRMLKAEDFDSIWKKGTPLPGLELAEGSPALDCGIDISGAFEFNGKKYPPLPGFKTGYFKGKAPAAGILQKHESPALYLELFRKSEDVSAKLRKGAFSGPLSSSGSNHRTSNERN